jgi:ABC-type transporter Mla subunit MlaD
MTTERWTDDMLDRLASTTTRILTSVTDLAEQNTRDISRLSNIVELHQQTLDMQQQNFNAVLSEIREMQAEVRGLQTENRRILDQLINRDGGNG